MKKNRRRSHKLINKIIKKAKRVALHGQPRWRQLLRAQRWVKKDV